MSKQCPSCGGFCKKSGCERENVQPQPDQEPVAWMHIENYIDEDNLWDSRKLFRDYDNGFGVPLYTTPPQEQRSCRRWVGLTNNDLQPIADEYRILFGSWVHDFARAIEAKLKEKNMPVFLGIRGGLAHDAGEKP